MKILDASHAAEGYRVPDQQVVSKSMYSTRSLTITQQGFQKYRSSAFLRYFFEESIIYCSELKSLGENRRLYCNSTDLCNDENPSYPIK